MAFVTKLDLPELPKNPLASSIATRLVKSYSGIFNVGEISDDLSLKWLSGAILLGFHVTFASWMYSSTTTLRAVADNTYTCWPFFQSCKSLIWLSTLPDGYSQTTVYMALFGIIVLAVYLIYRERWAGVHACIAVLFAAKIYFTLINYEFKGNYDYYHNSFCLIFLFLPYKKFFSQLAIVLFYFLSTATKIHPSWILGQYFTSLVDGLPIFPAGSEIFMTNLVIVMEMIGAWFLFSRNWLLQRTVLVFFILFHLYSGILVGYRYPTTVLPPLLILFGPWFRPYERVPLDRRAVPGWTLAGGLLGLQLLPHMIPGDEKLTLEGNFFGLYMFEANHQCFVTISNKGKIVDRHVSVNPRNRCDPYEYWFRAKNTFCEKSDGGEYSLTFTHSINGGPFLEIVNERDLCHLDYRAFAHNSWIKLEDEAAAVGRPVANRYR